MTKSNAPYTPFSREVFFANNTHRCRLKLGSWLYDGTLVNVTNHGDQMNLEIYVAGGEWELINTLQQRNEVIYPWYVDRSLFPVPFFYHWLFRAVVQSLGPTSLFIFTFAVLQCTMSSTCKYFQWLSDIMIDGAFTRAELFHAYYSPLSRCFNFYCHPIAAKRSP